MLFVHRPDCLSVSCGGCLNPVVVHVSVTKVPTLSEVLTDGSADKLTVRGTSGNNSY